MRLNRIVIFLSLQCALFFSGFGQPVDDLKLRFNSAGITFAEKALVSSEIANGFMSTSHDSAKYYASYGLNLSLQNNFPSGIFKNSCTLGKILLKKDSINEAVRIFENARQYTHQLEDKRDALCIYLLLGYSYDMLQDYYRAHEALYSGLKIAEETCDSMMLWSYFNNIGVHHMKIDDYRKSLEFLYKAVAVFYTLSEDQKKFSLASTYNNIGVTYIDLDQPDSAELYLKKALSIPDITGDFYGLSNLYGNLGKVSLMKNESDKALDYFLQAGIFLDSLKGGFPGTMAPLYANNYNYLSKVYFIMGQLDKAMECLSKSLDYSKISSDLVIQTEGFQRLSQIYEIRGDLKSALIYNKKYQENLDSLNVKKADEKISKLTIEYEFEKELVKSRQEMELMEFRIRRKELIYIFIIVTGFGILISVFLLYLLQRNKMKRKKLEEKALLLEKEIIAEELDYKNKELTTSVLYLLKKNEFILSISQKLDQVLTKLKDEDAHFLKRIISELDNNTSNDVWEEFEIRFKEVHSNFYNRLSQQFPDLTAQDLRLCAFLRLNMTNKEIAAITFQSLDSLKTARYRLRKKLDLDRDENLVAFFAKL